MHLFGCHAFYGLIPKPRPEKSKLLPVIKSPALIIKGLDPIMRELECPGRLSQWTQKHEHFA
jgi:hypothetical protein